MNKVELIGRLTRDPEVRYSTGENPLAIARYTLAVNRRFRREGENTADFINCVAFGPSAEFAEKYYHQGLKIAIVGRIQTGSYTNREGQKVYTTEVVVEEQEFVESKAASEKSASNAAEPAADSSNNSKAAAKSNSKASKKTSASAAPAADEGFETFDDDEELPFN